MADNPIGISFIPSNANGAAQNQGDASGGSDLASAFKILSLQLPRVVGGSAPVSSRLLTAPGGAAPAAAPAAAGGFNPYTAIFQALLAPVTSPGQSSSPFTPAASSYAPDVSATSPDMSGGGTPLPKFTFPEKPIDRSSTPPAGPVGGGGGGTLSQGRLSRGSY